MIIIFFNIWSDNILFTVVVIECFSKIKKIWKTIFLQRWELNWILLQRGNIPTIKVSAGRNKQNFKNHLCCLSLWGKSLIPSVWNNSRKRRQGREKNCNQSSLYIYLVQISWGARASLLRNFLDISFSSILYPDLSDSINSQ